jgi:hypothetical protein
MKKVLYTIMLVCILSLLAAPVVAQCSICTRTAAQMGEKPAKGLNSGILYLAFVPFAVVGFIGYRWWKNNSGIPDGNTDYR